MVPDGYSLVAQVDVIANTVELDFDDPRVMDINTKARQYRNGTWTSSRIMDYNASQIVFSRDTAGEALVPTHVDIEPRIADYGSLW